MIRQAIYKIKQKLRILKYYPSETSKIRGLVLPYCIGYGCDIGFGGDKIKADAVGIDLPSPYAHVGKDQIDIACDVINGSIPVPSDLYDYVFSSHLIEDYEDTLKGLNEFIRVAKSGGNLILAFPDQATYEIYCKKHGIPLNQFHKHPGMGLNFMKEVIKKANLKNYQILFEANRVVDYNVVIVFKIFK